jgi:hypothetical protein
MNIILLINILISIFLLVYNYFVIKFFYIILFIQKFKNNNPNNSVFDEFTLASYFIIIPIILSLIIKKYTKFNFLISYFIGFLIQWIIFINVNPYPLHINNKLSIMNLIPKIYRPHIQFCLSEIYNKKFNFPIIIKPKICSGCGANIETIKTSKDLKLFLKKIEHKKENINTYMVQNYLYNYPVEIGILYEKLPFQKEGKIIEIIEKTHKNEIKIFINYDIINHNHLINQKLNKLFDNLSKKIPNLNVGRYDIRLKSIDDLIKGKFKIIEINGTMGFPFDTPTANYKYTLLNKIRDISVELRWYFARIFIGIVNILTLQGYSLINLIKAMIQSYQNVYKCDDWENIFSLYS